MNSLYLAALVLIVMASVAKAKDVTITFNETEQQALIQVLDQATRTGGLTAAQGTLYFANKLQAAVNAAPAASDPKAKPKK